MNYNEPSYQHNQAWMQWAMMVEQQLKQQQFTIQELQKEIEQLKQKAAQQEDSRVFHVEKIEYHFDQLKVDTLEGSLQIGLSTTNPGQLPTMIEDFALNQQAQNANPPQVQTKKGKQANPAYQTNQPFPNQAAPAPVLQQTFDKLKQALTQNMVPYIERQSSLHHVQLTKEHIQLILDDLEQQLMPRIHHYYAQYHYDKPMREDDIVLALYKQTLHDLEQAIDLYIHQLVQGDEKT